VRPTVGLVAGEGRLAEVLAERMRAAGRRVVCVQVHGEPGRLPEVCDRYVHVPLDQALRGLQVLQEEGVRELVLAGKVDKLRAVSALPGAAGLWPVRAPDRRDPQLWPLVARILGQAGIRVLPQPAFAPDLVAGTGLLAGREPDPQEREDLRFAFRMARQVAAAGIGQAVAVRGGVVLAVEAVEGTDAMIRRCREFGPGAVVAKVAWPGADPRFDLPVVGSQTLQAMRWAGAKALGVEAGSTLVLDRPAFEAAAAELGVSVVGWPPEES
jgi:DUF1009 family protein